MSRNEKNSKSLIFIVLLALTAAVLFVLLVYACFMLKKNSENRLSNRNGGADIGINGMNGSGQQEAVLSLQNDALRKKISELETEIEELKKLVSDSDYYDKLKRDTDELKKQLSEKESELIALKSAMTQGTGGFDLSGQYGFMTDFYALMEGRPEIVRSVVKKTDGIPDTDELGQAIYEDVSSPSRVSVVMYDIDSGVSFTYNSEEIFASAGLESVLLADGIFSFYADGTDFDEIITYTEADYKGGSGKLKNAEFGTEYTVSELISYALGSTDLAAYKMLNKRFGEAVSRSVGSSGFSVFKGSGQVCASEMTDIMKVMYRHFQSGSEWIKESKEAMLNCAHSELISEAVDHPVAQIYAWNSDVYHDCGIVYDEHPYILVLLTDLSAGGESENEFLRSAIKILDGMHGAIYEKH